MLYLHYCLCTKQFRREYRLSDVAFPPACKSDVTVKRVRGHSFCFFRIYRKRFCFPSFTANLHSLTMLRCLSFLLVASTVLCAPIGGRPTFALFLIVIFYNDSVRYTIASRMIESLSCGNVRLFYSKYYVMPNVSSH